MKLKEKVKRIHLYYLYQNTEFVSNDTKLDGGLRA